MWWPWVKYYPFQDIFKIFLYLVEIDAVYIPPNVDELTDEEEFSEDVERSEENRNIDIAGTFEIHTNESDLYDDSDEETLAVKRQNILEQNQTDLKPVWRSGQIIHQNVPQSREEEMMETLRNQLENLSPLEIFFKFFDDSILTIIDTAFTYPGRNCWTFVESLFYRVTTSCLKLTCIGPRMKIRL